MDLVLRTSALDEAILQVENHLGRSVMTDGTPFFLLLLYLSPPLFFFLLSPHIAVFALFS